MRCNSVSVREDARIVMAQADNDRAPVIRQDQSHAAAIKTVPARTHSTSHSTKRPSGVGVDDSTVSPSLFDDVTGAALRARWHVLYNPDKDRRHLP